MEKAVEILKITGPWAAVLLGIWAILNVIGEICTLKGKIVPEFMNIRRYFKRKKAEKTRQQNLIQNVEKLLAEVNEHYSEDNIQKRNKWMEWVNQRAVVYDRSVEDLKNLQLSLIDNNRLTLDLYININRNRIIDFASKVANCTGTISREEFNRIFKIYKEYEEVLEKHHMTNGEVDIAIRVIDEAYKERLIQKAFLEDERGYN